VKGWSGRASFWAPWAFRHLSVELLKPVYVPAYLVSGVASGVWMADVGYTYSERKKGGGARLSQTECHYSEAAIVGWPAEEPARNVDALDEPLMNEVQAAMAPRLRALVPGEKVARFRVESRLTEPAFATVLVPVWTMMIRWSPTRSRIRVLVNGQTGQVTGSVPTSWLKVTFAVVLAVGALGAAIWWLSKGGR